MVGPVPASDHGGVSMVTSPDNQSVAMVTAPEHMAAADMMADHVDMEPIDAGSRRPSFLTSIAESAIDYISCRRCGLSVIL